MLQNLSPAVQEQLSARSSESVPEQICMNCYRELTSGDPTAAKGNSGSALMAAEKAREQKKLMLWKSRVNFIKKARALMGERAFSEAAVAYEKYIRVLEVVYDAKPGGLTPENFKDSARTQELTVVASVYWDLLRIYDTSEKYGDRQVTAAQKLAQFLKFTPIYPDIIRRAEAFQKTAKNPGVVKTFLKSAAESKGRCFIATAAFESENAPEVLHLRQYRDNVLAHSVWGMGFIAFYESVSPPIAACLDRYPRVKPSVRKILRLIARKIPSA